MPFARGQDPYPSAVDTAACMSPHDARRTWEPCGVLLAPRRRDARVDRRPSFSRCQALVSWPQADIA
jgi:hypothetical protein